MNCFPVQVVGFALISLGLVAKADDEPEVLEFRLESDTVREELEIANAAVVENLLMKVFVVVDFSLYARWLEVEGNDKVKAIANIRYFYAHLINLISNKFSSIDTGPYRYKTSICGYYIIQTALDSTFSESKLVKTSNPGKINFEEALKILKEWVAKRTDIIKNYGVVAAFTKYSDVSAVGMANMRTFCTKIGLSIVSSGPLYSTASLAAHELGHSLGSEHDGSGNECDPNDHYIMTPKLGGANISRYHTFSPCSRKYFEKYVNSIKSSVKETCFKEEKSPLSNEVEKYLSELPGLKYTPDQMCQRAFGLKSYACMGGGKAHLKICESISCFDTTEGKTVCNIYPEARGLDGTSCGNKYWCMDKKCVYDERAPANKEFCLYGDSHVGTNFGKKKYYCSDVAKNLNLCNYNFFEESCCKTCAEFRNNTSVSGGKNNSSVSKKVNATNSSTELVYLKLYFVLDFSVYMHWLEFTDSIKDKAISFMKLFYNHIFDEIKKKFLGLTQVYKYKVLSYGWFVAESAEDSDFTETSKVSSDTTNYIEALEKFSQWMAKHKEKPDFSVAVAFTRYFSQSGVSGSSFIGTACTDKGLAIVQETGLYSTALVAAHEIGHSLGAHNDGERNTCKRKELFVMTPIAQPNVKNNYHRFSHCSRNYFIDYIGRMDRNGGKKCLFEPFAEKRNVRCGADENIKTKCIEEGVEDFIDPIIIANPPGIYFTLDHQCQHVFGPNSTYCRIIDDDLDECAELSCVDPSTETCTLKPEARAYDGTPCANRRWCMHKTCTKNPYYSGEEVESKCKYLPDYEGQIKFGDKVYTCDDVKLMPGNCYYKSFYHRCCQACEMANRGRTEDCKYGDYNTRVTFQKKIRSCDSFAKESWACYDSTFKKTCCLTCKKALRPWSGCEYGNRASNCEIKFQIYGSKFCKSKANRDLCCETCMFA